MIGTVWPPQLESKIIAVLPAIRGLVPETETVPRSEPLMPVPTDNVDGTSPDDRPESKSITEVKTAASAGCAGTTTKKAARAAAIAAATMRVTMPRAGTL